MAEDMVFPGHWDPRILDACKCTYAHQEGHPKADKALLPGTAVVLEHGVRARPALIELLQEIREMRGNPGRRSKLAALHAIWVLGDTPSVETLGDVLLNDEDPIVRLAAARCFEDNPPKGAFDYLQSASRDSDGFVRMSAIRAMGHSDDVRHVEALSTLCDDEDESVAITAVLALGELGSLDAESRLRTLATSQRGEVAAVAKRELGRLRPHRR